MAKPLAICFSNGGEMHNAHEHREPRVLQGISEAEMRELMKYADLTPDQIERGLERMKQHDNVRYVFRNEETL